MDLSSAPSRVRPGIHALSDLPYLHPVTGLSRTSEGLDPRRRRALFRAWHRGMREVDLLLGPFADTHIADFGDHDLAEFEALLEVPDDELLTWLIGKFTAPPAFQTGVLRSIVEFHTRRHDQN
jgi:antitoxin CptB